MMLVLLQGIHLNECLNKDEKENEILLMKKLIVRNKITKYIVFSVFLYKRNRCFIQVKSQFLQKHCS